LLRGTVTGFGSGQPAAAARISAMYFTDRGIEELTDRRGTEEVTLAWLGSRLREFTDSFPEFETAVDRLATWLARLDDDLDDDLGGTGG
jgi:hypothetical protein